MSAHIYFAISVALEYSHNNNSNIIPGITRFLNRFWKNYNAIVQGKLEDPVEELCSMMFLITKESVLNFK